MRELESNRQTNPDVAVLDKIRGCTKRRVYEYTRLRVQPRMMSLRWSATRPHVWPRIFRVATFLRGRRAMADAMAEDEPAGGDVAIAPAHAQRTWISRKRANDKYKALVASLKPRREQRSILSNGPVLRSAEAAMHVCRASSCGAASAGVPSCAQSPTQLVVRRCSPSPASVTNDEHVKAEARAYDEHTGKGGAH